MTGEPRRSLLDDLGSPEAYPAPRPSRVTLVTTHISWVFLTDREVWKLKRPVDYGFVDYTTLERRRRCCEDEVRLNRRLAPDVYLGVVPVRLGPRGHWFGPDGDIVDYAVRMRRLSDECSAEALLRRGELTPSHLARLATRLARFFADAAITPAAGAMEAIRDNVVENFAQAEPFIGRFVSRETFDGVRRRQLRFLDEESGQLRSRVEQGRIRDGHGDLRLEHVYFEHAEPTVIDCVEFNERLRFGDVASDVAFLAMELTARSRGGLAEVFLAAFALASDDHDLYGVIDFYAGYRAWVRGKVAAFLAADAATPPEKAARKAEEARSLFELARSYAKASRGAPPVIAVGGMIGSGKTTLAEALGQGTGIPVVSSDRVRKALAGVRATDRAPDEAYTAAFSARTFDELYRRAAVVLGSGRGVVLDATFRDRAHRLRARDLARRHGRRFLFVETVCDEPTLRERLRRRAAGPSISDAGESLLERIRAEFEPVRELGAGEHVRVDTSGSPEAAVRAVLDAVGPARAMKSMTLADGSTVAVRPIRPEDESALTALYERLSPQTAYQRFFTMMRRLPPDWAHILANVDYDRRMAIAAIGPGGELIGVARYAYDPETDEAEIALVIEDRWQGRGLGKRLLGELIDYADGVGIRRFRAYVLADNVRMLNLLRRVTTVLEKKLESGVVSLLLATPRRAQSAATGGPRPSP